MPNDKRRLVITLGLNDLDELKNDDGVDKEDDSDDALE